VKIYRSRDRTVDNDGADGAVRPGLVLRGARVVSGVDRPQRSELQIQTSGGFAQKNPTVILIATNYDHRCY